MKKIGITGSLASGKTTASKILSSGKGPLFNADVVVKSLYKKSSFRKIISKRFNIKNNLNLKRSLKNKIKEDETNIQKLERIVHPLVRKEMYEFMRKNKKKNFIFFEIPLLIESKLMNYFDIIFFIKARKSIRLRRFLSKGGKREIFNILNKKQLSDTVKIKYSDHVVVNEKKFNVLKKNLLDIFKKYE
tara:strand:- start:451 stop:1017 length:567 start_codon:yes stop_codon:yes gene_type:complete